MALEAAFGSLWRQVHELRDAFIAMQLTVVEDRPHESDIVPVQALGDAVADLIGVVQEMLEGTSDGLGAIRTGGKLGAVRGALLRAQQAANDAGRLLASDVADRARLRDLEDLAGNRGRAWGLWMAGVTEAVERCGPPLWDVQRELLSCWSELTDRLVERPAAPATDTAV